MNLQAELAYVQARLSSLQRLPPLPPQQCQSPSPPNHHSSSDMAATADSLQSNSNLSQHFDPPQQHPTLTELTSFFNLDGDLEDEDVQALAQEVISRYMPGVRFRASSPP